MCMTRQVSNPPCRCNTQIQPLMLPVISSPLPSRADRDRQISITTMNRPRLPVIPSTARNLKSITARPDTRCPASIITKSENGGRPPMSALRQDRHSGFLDSAALRSERQCRVAFWSMESGAIGKYLPLSARWGRDTERGSSRFNSLRLNNYSLVYQLTKSTQS